jgi:hypothetical protein
VQDAAELRLVVGRRGRRRGVLKAQHAPTRRLAEKRFAKSLAEKLALCALRREAVAVACACAAAAARPHVLQLKPRRPSPARVRLARRHEAVCLSPGRRRSTLQCCSFPDIEVEIEAPPPPG